MAYTIPFPVNSEGYSAKVMPGVNIETPLPGGFPRVERNFSNVYYTFEVSFELNAAQYAELKTIYDQYLRVPQPVILDLISSAMGLTPHSCWITPGSWKLEKTDARAYFKVSIQLVGAQLAPDQLEPAA